MPAKKKAEVKEAETTVAKPLSNPDMQKYSKLLGTADYDHEAAEQLADALNEINELKRRATQLEQVVKENKELHQFIWCTADGLNKAIHKIDDEHLGNIMLHLVRNNRAISRAIRGEAMRRNIVIPTKVPVDWGKREGTANQALIESSLRGSRPFVDDEEDERLW